jgi:hypothetical protein
LAELLSEHQRHAREPLGYRPQPVPASQIESIFAAALKAESANLRVGALNALEIAGLNAALASAAAENLKHDHWLVRLFALRVLARQGPGFLDTAAQLSTDDPDELVRELARSYVERWSAPAAPPATQPIPEPAPGAAP